MILDAKRSRAIEPFGTDISIRLHVMHAGAIAGTGLDQFARVVARAATDDDDDVCLACHLDCRRLPFFGRFADCVDEAHLGPGESPLDQGHHVAHLLDRLCRLRGHADAWMFVERKHVIVFEHNVEAIQIAGEAAHLDVVALTNDDDVVAVAREGGNRAVCDAYERTCRFDHIEPERAGPREGTLGRAVGRHHHRGRRDVCNVLRDGDALGFERAQDVGIVDEVTEDGERASVGALERERDGIAHAKAHAEVGSADNPHRNSVHK
jgi:hypothetical protein